VLNRPIVSVLVCTLARKRRRALLERAIDSILVDQDGLGRPVVVVNGTECDEALRRELQARTDLTLIYRPRPGLSAALIAGRRQVDTPFFATLDDDDQLLPGALATRLAPLLADPTTDLVVTNGYYDDGRSPARLHYQNFMGLAPDPMRSVMEKSWLQSINALYRSERVTAQDLEGMPHYLEWTWLALKLARSHTIRFLDTPTYRLNRGEPDSLSFSDAFYLGVPDALRAMLALDLPLDVRRELRQRLSASLHDVSDRARRSGDYRLAWRSHIASLGVRPSCRWLFYTRRLLIPLADRGEDEGPSEAEPGLPS
jgi:glycosyltransferase involved in cell wall biosynthesis